MTKTIAVAGKGGVGKTTLCGLLVKYLAAHGQGPILAVDADANSNLNEVLGIEVENTLGSIREEVARAGDNPDVIPASMTKQDYMQFKINSALAEEDDYDMLVMGRTQGKGCYCFANDLLRAQLRSISNNYKTIVVDNEAGMEHISRGILPNIDVMLLVSDCSRRGIQAVGRIARLVEELQLNPSVMKLIINRAPSLDLDAGVIEEINNQGLDLLGVVPHDPLVYQYDCEGKPTSILPESSVSRIQFEKLLGELL